MVGTILIVAAFILALLEAFMAYIPGIVRRPNLGWLAIALYFLALVLGGGGHV